MTVSCAHEPDLHCGPAPTQADDCSRPERTDTPDSRRPLKRVCSRLGLRTVAYSSRHASGRGRRTCGSRLRAPDRVPQGDWHLSDLEHARAAADRLRVLRQQWGVVKSTISAIPAPSSRMPSADGMKPERIARSPKGNKHRPQKRRDPRLQRLNDDANLVRRGSALSLSSANEPQRDADPPPRRMLDGAGNGVGGSARSAGPVRNLPCDGRATPFSAAG